MQKRLYKGLCPKLNINSFTFIYGSKEKFKADCEKMGISSAV